MYPASVSNPASLIMIPKPIKHRNQKLRLKLPRCSPAVHSSFHQRNAGVSYSFNVYQTHAYAHVHALAHHQGEKDDGGWKHDSGVTIASADGSDAICVQSGLKLQLLRRKALGGIRHRAGRREKEIGNIEQRGSRGVSGGRRTARPRSCLRTRRLRGG